MAGGFEDDGDTICGTPIILWTSSFRIAYSISKLGVLFNGWPDGRSAEDQPQLMIEVFDRMRGEAMDAIATATRESR